MSMKDADYGELEVRMLAHLAAAGWQPMPHPRDLPADSGCILVRRRKANGGWSLAIAYYSVSDAWRTESGRPLSDFEEWLRIPA